MMKFLNIDAEKNKTTTIKEKSMEKSKTIKAKDMSNLLQNVYDGKLIKIILRYNTSELKKVLMI